MSLLSDNLGSEYAISALEISISDILTTHTTFNYVEEHFMAGGIHIETI